MTAVIACLVFAVWYRSLYWMDLAVANLEGARCELRSVFGELSFEVCINGSEDFDFEWEVCERDLRTDIDDRGSTHWRIKGLGFDFGDGEIYHGPIQWFALSYLYVLLPLAVLSRGLLRSNPTTTEKTGTSAPSDQYQRNRDSKKRLFKKALRAFGIISIVVFTATTWRLMVVLAIVAWRFVTTGVVHIEKIDIDELYTPPTISRETTYVTGPVKEDGTVDYFAAINQKISEGVTVEDNAAVWFAKAGIGLIEFNSDQRAAYCKMLGIETCIESDEWFNRLLNLSDDEREVFKEIMSKPWSADEYPFFDEWVSSNELALELIIKGTHCPKCYIPVVPDAHNPRLLEATLAAEGESHEVVQCLAARAMLNLNQGKIIEAQRDLLACHRLGQLIGTSPHMVSGIISNANDQRGNLGDIALLQYANLSASDSMSYQKELRQLIPLPSTVEKFDFAERLGVLDASSSLGRISTVRVPKMPESVKVQKIQELRIMGDECLRVCNEHFDVHTAAARLPTFAAQINELEHLLSELRANPNSAGETGVSTSYSFFLLVEREPLAEFFMSLEKESPKTVGRRFGEIVVGRLLPNLKSGLEWEQQSLMRRELIQIGFGLAAYRADHGDYPESLQSLTPKYIDRIPKDRFVDADLQFVSGGDSYWLYSVGPNGVDDQGLSKNDEPCADDITLKINPH